MESIRLSALGRDVHVGNLYNYFNDNILPDAIRVLRHNLEINPNYEVAHDFFFQLPHKYKRHVLGINSHLDQSIEGGSMNSKSLWFAGYLQRQSTQDEDDNTAQVDVIFRISKRTVCFRQHYLDQQKMYEYRLTTGGKATHLVEKVVYGAEFIISMRRALDLEIESKASAEGSIYLAAKAYFETIDSKMDSDEQPAELGKINCTIYSSLDPGNVKSGTFEDSYEMVRDAIVSSNENNWQPIEITLKNIPAQIEARIWSEKMSDVDDERERHLAMLKAIIKESNVISKHPFINRVPPFEKAMCQFLDLLAPFWKEIENSYSLFFVNMQSQEQFLSDMKPISDLLTEMTDWLIHRRKEIGIMCSLLSDINLPMTDLEEIKSNVSSGKEKRTRVFVLKMDYIQDLLIDRLAKFIGNQQESFKIPVFWMATSGKHRIEHLNRLLKAFDSLNTKCSSLDYSYQIGLVPFSSSVKDGTVTPIGYSTKDLSEVVASELSDRPIQPSEKSEESQPPSSSPANSMLFPPVETSLAPTVYNQQQLRASQRMTSNLKHLGPIKSVHLSIDEDTTKEKNVPKKEPELAIPSSPTDNQIKFDTSLSFDSVKDIKYEENPIGTTSITSIANVRKKSFESIQDNDSMKQASKLRLITENQIERDAIEPNNIKEKSQPTKNPSQSLPAAVRIKNYKSRENPHDEENEIPYEATQSTKPDPPAQECSPSHQPVFAVHQQDPDRQQIEIWNKDKSCDKETVSSQVAVKKERVAEMFAQETNQYAKLIKPGQPNVNLLNAKENLINEDFRWFNIDKSDATSTHEDSRDHKVIILMGATGCGKSTLINGMINYILGVQWNDPFRFKCVRDDETMAKNQAHSQTSSVTAYTLRHHEGMAVPYSITIIDTPGYGDTRGVQRDKLITNNIHRFLTQQETRVDEIHAACFVAASGDSRLTATQRYIIDSVLSIFGKDVKPNMRLLVTFADNADPPVVEACLAAQFPVTSASAGITYSKFNSSVLYASNEKHGDDELCFDELFWDMGQENFYKFFTMLETMNGRDLKSTREVIQRRQQLEQSLKDIEVELESSLSNIEDMEKIRLKLRECKHNMEANQNFVLEKTEMRNKEMECDKGFFAYNCKRCKKTCEKPARIKDYEKRKCTDRVCDCSKNAHVYQQFALVPVIAKVTTTHLDMKAEFESNYKRKLTSEDLMTKCLDELNMAKGKVLSLLEQVGANARSLDSTALRSNALSPAEYLSLMRSRVLEEQAPGYLTRLQTLTELQQSLNAPAVPSTTTKMDKSLATPAQPTSKPGVNKGPYGRGRGILPNSLQGMNSSGNPGQFESIQCGRGEAPFRPTQNCSDQSKIPPTGTSANLKGTIACSRSNKTGINETNSNFRGAASTQTTAQGTKVDGGVGRGNSRNIPSTKGTSSNVYSGNLVGHPPGEPENYYTLSSKAFKPCQTKGDSREMKPDTVSSTSQSTTKLYVNEERNPVTDPEVISSFPLESKDGFSSSEEEIEQRVKPSEKTENIIQSIIRKLWPSK